MDVSVIVPVFNDPGRLRLCLAALEDQDFASEAYEVIVVDNASDRSVEPVVAPFAHARAAFEPRPGSFAARNRGLDLATGEVIAFTDADCIPAPDWLSQGVAALRGPPGRGIVGGKIEVFPRRPSRPNPVEVFEMLYGYRQKEIIELWHGCATANVFTYRRAFEVAGKFNPDLLARGDLEWPKRAIPAGFASSYADSVRVRHPARRSLGDLWRRTARLTGGNYLIEHGINDEIEGVWYRQPPRSEDWARLRDYAGVGMLMKAAVVGVAIFARLAVAAERLRLSRGGAPRR